MLIAHSLETMLSASLLLAAAMGSISATPAAAAPQPADATPAKADPRIAQIATIHPKAGQEAVLAERIQALVPHTRKESGCLRYEMFQKQDGTWLVFEYWADEAALTAHFAAPYSAAFLKDMHAFVEGDPEVTVFKSVNLAD